MKAIAMRNAKQAWAPLQQNSLMHLLKLRDAGELDFKGTVLGIRFYDHPLKTGKNWVCEYGQQWYQTNIRWLPTADQITRAARARPVGSCMLFGKLNFLLDFEHGQLARKVETARVVSPH